MEGLRKHGLVHCSQMANFRVEDVTDVCKMGDTVFVKVCLPDSLPSAFPSVTRAHGCRCLPKFVLFLGHAKNF